MKKFSRKSVVIIGIALLGFVIVAIPKFGFGPINLINKFGKGMKAKGFYYCPMHPTYTSDQPGDCPICNMKLVRKSDGATKGKKGRKILYYRHPMGQPDTSPVPKKDSMGMDYIPVYEDEAMGKASTVSTHATVHIPIEKQQLIGVKLGAVEKQKLAKEIRTVGRVAFDPELYAAQQEFISAVESLEKARGGPYHEPLERSGALLEATKVRLRLLGMSEAEISELEANAVRDRNLILPDSSSLRGSGSNEAEAISSSEIASLPAVARNDAKRVQTKDRIRDNYVWVYGTVYEHEIPYVQIGTEVRAIPPTFTDREFLGEVSGLDPVLDSKTRSIRVRARVKNPDGFLKPEMYVDLHIKTDFAEALVVPEEAVMQTGERAIVFVSQGEGYFEPREVKLGVKSGKFYEVKSGLQEGEQIVVSGNFLIDSESRLQAALSGMGGGHTHGG